MGVDREDEGGIDPEYREVVISFSKPLFTELKPTEAQNPTPW